MYKASEELSGKWLGIGVDGDTIIYCGEELSSENIYGTMAGIFLAIAEGAEDKEGGGKAIQWLQAASVFWLEKLTNAGGQEVDVLRDELSDALEKSDLLNKDGKPFDNFIIAIPHKDGVAVRMNFGYKSMIQIVRSTMNLMKDIEDKRYFPEFLCVYTNMSPEQIEKETEQAKYNIGGTILDYSKKDKDEHKGN